MNNKVKTWSLVGCGMLLYSAVLCFACWSRYSQFIYSDFDLAIHAQSTWNITQGSMDSSILGIPFLGNHMVLILFLIAPLYAILPSPYLLLCVQTIILACGAIPVFLLARRILSPAWGVLFAFVYLLYPPLCFMNLYEFHPVCLAATFLLFAIYHHEAKEFRRFLFWLAMALLCQENIPLVAVFFGFYSLARHRTKRWFWTPFLTGLLLFVLFVFVLMPAWNQGTVQFSSLYQHLGASPAAAVKNMILHPLQTASMVITPNKMAFLGALLTPLAFLPLVNPVALIPMLPVLAQRLLSGRFSESTILYHYQAEFIPFLFAAAIFGTARLLRIQNARFKPIVASLIIVTTIGSFILADVPGILNQSMTANHADKAAILAQKKCLADIPPDAAVISTFRHLPSLANRTRLYSLHHIYYGRYTLSSRPYPMPTDIDYIIMDTPDPLTFASFYNASGYLNLQTLLNSDSWALAFEQDGFLLFRRESGNTSDPFNRFDLVQYELPTNQPPTNAVGVQLLGHVWENLDAEGNVDLVLRWMRCSEEVTEQLVILEIIESASFMESKLIFPGHRIWPPQSWPPYMEIIDRHRLHLTQPPASTDALDLRIHAAPWPP